MAPELLMWSLIFLEKSLHKLDIGWFFASEALAEVVVP
jgi:hypothetical protein